MGKTVAQKLFEEEGYVKYHETAHTLEYRKMEDDWKVRIIFSMANREVVIEYSENGVCYGACLSSGEVRAIYRQEQELGWKEEHNA